MSVGSLAHVRSIAILGSAALAVGWSPRSPGDHAQRLNAPLDHQEFTGDVDSFRVTPDGKWVVYRAQQDDPVAGLYVARADQDSTPLLVSEPGIAVTDFQLSPTGARIVYLTADGRLIKLGPSGVRVRLNPAPVSGGSVQSFRISPDGKRVVYRADQDTDQVFQVYSVPILGGTAPVALSPDFASTFAFTSDSARVVYLAAGGLFSVPVDGSAPALALCGAFVSGGHVSTAAFTGAPEFQLSPNNQRVVYMADQLVDDQVELFSVPVDGSQAPVRLNAAPVPGGDVQLYGISPDSRTVVYVADQDVNDLAELFVSPLDGSTPPVQLSLTERPTAFGDSLAFSPSGTHVAYVARPGGRDQLFCAPLDASQAPLQLSNPTSQVRNASFTPDSSSILYRSDPGVFLELFVVPRDGSSSPRKLNAPPLQLGEVTHYRLTPGGDEVVYRIQNRPGAFELFRARLDGSVAPVALGLPGRNVEADFALAGSSVCFRCDLAVDRVVELCAVPLDASEPPRRLSGPLLQATAVTEVTSFALARDGKSAVYGTGTGLFRIPLDEEGAVRVLTPPSYLDRCSGVRVSADSSRVHFLGVSRDRFTQIFSVPSDGSANPLQLSFNAVFGVFGFTEAPDGSRLSYSSSPYEGPPSLLTVPPHDPSGSRSLGRGAISIFTPDGHRLLFREVPDPFADPSPVRLLIRAADASSPAIELAPRTPAGTVSAFQMTPDGTKAVFCCDLELTGKLELFSVPTDGALPPARLSGAMADDRDVSNGFTLTADGLLVLYAADRDAKGVFELFVVPVDGSSAPRKLSGTMVAGGDVVVVGPDKGPFVRVSPDSSLVVFVADKDADERYELYSVPLDASRPPLKLNPPLVANGDVRGDQAGLRLSRDGTRVVFLADAIVDERVELFSAPTDGVGRVRTLSGTMVPQGDVESGFVVLQRSDAVVFLADRRWNDGVELWLAQLDGRAPPRLCCELEHANADVLPDFQVAADEGFVYYRADALVDEREELFRFPLERTPPHRPR